MNTPRRIRPIEKHVRAIMLLDCSSTAAKQTQHYASKTHMTPTNAKVTAVASLRALLDAFADLHFNLSAILSTPAELGDFFDLRRALTERVIPESMLLFEFCRQKIVLNERMNSPLATKVADLANKVADQCDSIKQRVNFAQEHHEIKYTVLKEIQRSVSENLTEASQAEPLFFSLDVGLPLRLQSLLKSPVAELYGNDIEELQNFSKGVRFSIQKRVAVLKRQEKPRAPSHGTRSESGSLKLFRGLKKPIKPIKDSDHILPIEVIKPPKPIEPIMPAGSIEPGPNDPIIPTPKKIKEPTKLSNLSTTPLGELRIPRARGSEVLQRSPSSKPRQVPVPQRISRPANTYKPRTCSSKENDPYDLSGKPLEVKKVRRMVSQIKPPTPIDAQNGAKPPRPLQIRESSANLSSRIARPTIITAKPSVSQLRKTSWQTKMETFNTSDSTFDLSDNSMVFTYHLASPSNHSFEETPLTRKSSCIRPMLALK